jgi:hypothetical protein
MAHIRIEMDLGLGWELRVDGYADSTVDQVVAQLSAFAIQYPHRAFVDGVLVGEVQPPRDACRSGGWLGCGTLRSSD